MADTVQVTQPPSEIVNLAFQATEQHQRELAKLHGELVGSLLTRETIGIDEGLHGVLGFSNQAGVLNVKDYDTYFESSRKLLSTVKRATLGNLAIFGRDGTLEVVGQLGENPLTLNFKAEDYPSSWWKRSLTAHAHFSFGVTVQPPFNIQLEKTGSRVEELSKPYLDIEVLSIRSYTGVRDMSHVSKVRQFEGVEGGFSLIDREDTQGRKLMGTFFDKLLDGSFES